MKRTGGNSLLEVIVALAILSVLVMGAAQFFATDARNRGVIRSRIATENLEGRLKQMLSSPALIYLAIAIGQTDGNSRFTSCMRGNLSSCTKLPSPPPNGGDHELHLYLGDPTNYTKIAPGGPGSYFNHYGTSLCGGEGQAKCAKSVKVWWEPVCKWNLSICERLRSMHFFYSIVDIGQDHSVDPTGYVEVRPEDVLDPGIELTAYCSGSGGGKALTGLDYNGNPICECQTPFYQRYDALGQPVFDADDQPVCDQVTAEDLTCGVGFYMAGWRNEPQPNGSTKRLPNCYRLCANCRLDNSLCGSSESRVKSFQNRNPRLECRYAGPGRVSAPNKNGKKTSTTSDWKFETYLYSEDDNNREDCNTDRRQTRCCCQFFAVPEDEACPSNSTC